MDTNEKPKVGASPIRIEAGKRLAEAEMETYQTANDPLAMPMDSEFTRTGE